MGSGYLMMSNSTTTDPVAMATKFQTKLATTQLVGIIATKLELLRLFMNTDS